MPKVRERPQWNPQCELLALCWDGSSLFEKTSGEPCCRSRHLFQYGTIQNYKVFPGLTSWVQKLGITKGMHSEKEKIKIMWHFSHSCVHAYKDWIHCRVILFNLMCNLPKKCCRIWKTHARIHINITNIGLSSVLPDTYRIENYNITVKIMLSKALDIMW